jgi:endoglucanase
MKRKILFSLAGFVFIFSCSKNVESPKQQENIIPISSLKATAGIKGGNWADARDNFQAGYVLPTGITASMSYSSIKSFSQSLATSIKNTVGTNTLRIPINISTVNNWWANYKGVPDGILAAGMKVIICYWCESGSGMGYVKDWNGFKTMWTTVVNAYSGNGNVYFEIINEPYGYSSANDLLNMYSSWLSDHSNAPRGRVICDGTGYSTGVAAIGSDSRISGCLLATHLYTWFYSGNHNLSDWYNKLLSNIGSSNYGRTIVTEAGCAMNTGKNFYGGSSSDNEICYLQGICNACRDKGIAMVYWPVVRDGDTYSMCTRNGTSVSIVNASAKNELNYAYGN